MAEAEAAPRLQQVEHLGNDLQVLGALHLWAHQRRDRRTYRGLDVAESVMPGSIDPYQNFGASFADRAGRGWDQLAAALLASFRHAVLEIKDDGVGTARVCGGDKLFPRDRNEQQRTPVRQIGERHRHHTIPLRVQAGKVIRGDADAGQDLRRMLAQLGGGAAQRTRRRRQTRQHVVHG